MTHLLAQFDRKCLDFHALEQFFDRLGAHHGAEARRTVLLVQLAVLGFVLDDLVLFDWGVAGLDRHVGFEVKDRFEVAQGDIQQMPDAAGQALEEPHM